MHHSATILECTEIYEVKFILSVIPTVHVLLSAQITNDLVLSKNTNSICKKKMMEEDNYIIVKNSINGLRYSLCKGQLPLLVH